LKKLICAIGMISWLCACTSTFAADDANQGSQNQERSYRNSIILYNNAPYDITYEIICGMGHGPRPIMSGSSDLYYTGGTHTNAWLRLIACTEFKSNGGRVSGCLSYVEHQIPIEFNAELVKSIDIKSVYDVKVTCLDGGTTSCLMGYNQYRWSKL
jgi:hypothetical protein